VNVYGKLCLCDASKFLENGPGRSLHFAESGGTANCFISFTVSITFVLCIAIRSKSSIAHA